MPISRKAQSYRNRLRKINTKHRRAIRKSAALDVSKPLRSKLTYGEQVNMVNHPPQGVAEVYNFTANGLFDPNITGSGHQPRTFDQIMPFYDHYIVTGAKMVARFSHLEEHPIVVGIVQRDSASSGTLNVEDILEYPKRKFITLAAKDAGGSVGTISSTMNVSKFLGRKVMGDPHLKGTASANPTEQCYFQLFAWKPSGELWAGDIAVDITIEYSATFVEPKLGISS